MTRATRFAFALLAAAAIGPASRTAHAEPPNAKATPVYVLSIWTDDSDDQADALTQALRSRVRQAQGWSLLETSQSFETLAIALKCPARPDPPCLQRIGDQLHADHYLWGMMGKKKAPGEVTADLHLWSRGKPEADASETYSENLKDASDESLRQIATRLFGRVTGGVAGGTLVVHAGAGGGSVTVDGVDKAALEGGVARVDVGAGAHTIGVRVPGFDSPAQPVSLNVGTEQEVTFALSPVVVPGAEATHSSFPMRKVVTYTALVAGVGLLVGGGVEGLAWMNDNNASKSDRKDVPASVTDVCKTGINPQAVDACQKSKDAVTASALGWTFAGVGAALVVTGFVLMVSDHGSSDSPRDASTTGSDKPKVDVVPFVGTRGGALDLRVTF
ncbi:MAG TPA: hypothetical protein VGL81_21810 [Polyangiaceae bacterium]|jgi:hypothetical protein